MLGKRQFLLTFMVCCGIPGALAAMEIQHLNSPGIPSIESAIL